VGKLLILLITLVIYMEFYVEKLIITLVGRLGHVPSQHSLVPGFSAKTFQKNQVVC